MAVSLTALLLEMPNSLRAEEPLAPTITLSLKRGLFKTYHFVTRTKNPDLPVIYRGWSMGAVQAVAAAGGQNSPRNLIGLILLSMDKRGRYGLRLPDKVGLERWEAVPLGSRTLQHKLQTFGWCSY